MSQRDYDAMGKNLLIEQEIEIIAAGLSAEDREFIRPLPENSLSVLHQTLGRTLRNSFRMDSYPNLFSHCEQQQSPETLSFDSISEAATKLIRGYLRNSGTG